MMEERYHATTKNPFYPDMSNANKNITVEAKLISPPTYFSHNCEFFKLTVLSSHFPQQQWIEVSL